MVLIMTDVIIVGSGGLGRELFSWLYHSKGNLNPIAFISDDIESLKNYDYPIPIISTIKDYTPTKNVKLIMAIMDPKGKRKVAELLLNKGGQFVTYIHPSVIIGCNVSIGEGCVLTPYCIITADVQLGKFNFLNTNTTIGHDVKIGDYSSFNGKVEVSGWCQIGNEVLIGSRVIILPKKKITTGVIVGAGSVVVGNINKPITVFGNPAKRV
jgi:sugar O-acyltransferase (sialic acid O-acetyltransferase NeuD family)